MRVKGKERERQRGKERKGQRGEGRKREIVGEIERMIERATSTKKSLPHLVSL